MPRRPLLLLALALAAGLLAYGVTRLAMRAPEHATVAATPESRLDWLTREFDLTPAARAAILQLQTDYAPICADHCSAIARAQSALAAATTTADRAAAEIELDRLRAVCATSTRAHLHAVAALMPAAQATRFLALMEPRIAHTDTRTGAPALDGRP